MAFNSNQRLNGLEPLAYAGVNAVQPPDFVTKSRPPNATDSKNFYLGTIWLDTTGYPTTLPDNEDIWMLVALVGNQATWVNFGGGDLETLTGNTGGPVSPDGADNINVVGDGTTINVAGNPGTNTLTISTVGTGVVNTLTGNTGGAVSPLAGNINVVGDGTTITIAGNPGTHTLTASVTGGILTTLHTQDGNNVTPTAGVINLSGAHGLNTTGTVGPNTATVAINNAITLGDLVPIIATNDALTIASGNITLQATNNVGNLNLPNTHSSANAGIITFGALRWISNFGLNNTFVGENSGNTTLTSASSTANTGVGTNALGSLTAGAANNCAIGVNAGVAMTTGAQNNLMGVQAGLRITTGSANCMFGEGSGVNLLTGNNNILLGFGTGSAYVAAESGNIIIGTNNPGVVGDTDIMRVNTIPGLAKVFYGGIRGVTTDVNDAVAVLISSNGQLGTVSSSRNVKDNIKDMGSYSNVIYNLRPVTFNYKKHSPQSVSVGLIAEEVYELVPQLVAHNSLGEIETVKYHDLVPMLLNEVQKHKEQLNKRGKVLEELLNRVRILEEKLL